MLNGQAYFSIISPKNNAKVTAGDDIEISWSHNNLTGKVIVSYSWDNNKWVTIDEVNIVEKQVWWEVPNTYDSDGVVSIKVQSLRRPSIYRIVNVYLPNYNRTTYGGQIASNYLNINTGKYINITMKKDNIRSQPFQGNNIIGKCKLGDYYEYLGDEGRWYVIRYNNQVAYTHKTNGRIVSQEAYLSSIKENEDIFCGCVTCLLLIGLLLLL